jgi:hypothetical protein
MGNIISLSERLEKWTTSYTSPDGRLQVKSSSHGRVAIQLADSNSRLVILDFVESVRMLSSVSNDMSFSLEVSNNREGEENANLTQSW